MRARSLACMVLLLASVGCGPSVPEDLERGTRVITAMASPRHLRQSMFVALFPEGRPSEFVSFLFSSMGAAEWPLAEDLAAGDPDPIEQQRLLGVPPVPSGVTFTPHSPKANGGRQIVVRYDDARRLVIVEAYVSPVESPVLVREHPFRLPELRPHELELLRRLAESNRDLGIPSQAF